MVESVKPQKAQNNKAQCLLGPGLTRYSKKKIFITYNPLLWLKQFSLWLLCLNRFTLLSLNPPELDFTKLQRTMEANYSTEVIYVF